MLESFDFYPYFTFYICKGVVYHGICPNTYNDYRFYVPYAYKHPQLRNKIYHLALNSKHKRIVEEYNFLNTEIDFDALLTQIAMGNINYIIVDTFDESTRKLYYAFRYAEAPSKRVKILRPISVTNLLNRLSSNKVGYRTLTIDPDKIRRDPHALEAYNCFDVIGGIENSEDRSFLNLFLKLITMNN